MGCFLIVKIHYPNCTNFEGNKILVFRDCTLQDLEEQVAIDPHFSDSKKYHHPIARFVPTEAGLRMAERFVRAMER